MSDHCPKCGAIVTAPALAAEVVAPVPGAPEGWSAEQLADALRPSQPQVAAAVEPQPVSPPRSAEPEPVEAPHVPRDEADARHGVLGSVLRSGPPRPPRPHAPSGQAEQRRPAAPYASNGWEVPAPTALHPHPQSLSTAREREEVAMPGMGEVLAGRAHPLQEDEERPLLHVPFMPVSDAPDQSKRSRRRQLTILGVACFLLFDVLFLMWYFQKPLYDWWSGDRIPSVQAVLTPPAKSKTSASGEPKIAQNPSVPPVEESPGVAHSTSISPAEQIPAPMAQVPDGVLTPASESTSGAAPAPSNPAPQLVGTTPLPALASSTSLFMGTSPTPEASPSANQTTGTPMGAEMQPAKTNPTLAANDLVLPPSDTQVPKPPPVPTPEPEPTLMSGSPIDLNTPLAPLPASAPGAPPRVGRVPAEARAALAALTKFLDAPNWKSRVPLVQRGQALAQSMEKHAAKYGDGVISVGSITFVERYPSRGDVPSYCMFEISGGTLKHPVITLIEETPKGNLVDWESFAEFKDDLLLKFLETRGAPPQKFRVLLRRKHYFEKDVPNMEEKDAYELQQPSADFLGSAFTVRKSPVSQQLSNHLSWGQDIPVIVELKWHTETKNAWVEITKIATFGWRS
ncbi:MAG: hypothetical protein ACOYMN_02725 [Roseimicrobium sp.]